MTGVLVSLRQSSGRGRRNSGTTDVSEGVASGVSLDQALRNATHNLNMRNLRIVYSSERELL